MRTTLLILTALAILAVATPLASAGPDGFGRCVITWSDTDTVLGEILSPSPDALPNERVPDGYECYW